MNIQRPRTFLAERGHRQMRRRAVFIEHLDFLMIDHIVVAPENTAGKGIVFVFQFFFQLLHTVGGKLRARA